MQADEHTKCISSVWHSATTATIVHLAECYKQLPGMLFLSASSRPQEGSPAFSWESIGRDMLSQAQGLQCTAGGVLPTSSPAPIMARLVTRQHTACICWCIHSCMVAAPCSPALEVPLYVTTGSNHTRCHNLQHGPLHATPLLHQAAGYGAGTGLQCGGQVVAHGCSTCKETPWWTVLLTPALQWLMHCRSVAFGIHVHAHA